MHQTTAVANQRSRSIMSAISITGVIGLSIVAIVLPATLFDLNLQAGIILLGLVAAVWILFRPRIALFQYVFFFFIEFAVNPDIPLYVIDLSTLLLIGAAVIDLLSGNHIPQRLPRLSLNYIAILLVIVVTGIFGFFPELLFRRFFSILQLLLAFWSVFQLSRHIKIRTALNWFFLLAALHAVYVAVPFFASGGTVRSFGLTTVFFDDIAMATVPIGVALYLGTRGTLGWWYLIGSMVVLTGLIATQSRAPLAFSVVATLFVIVVVWWQSRTSTVYDRWVRISRVRLVSLALLGCGAIVLGAYFFSDTLSGVISRFGLLFDRRPDWSAMYRIRLWEWAWRAFINHPVIGVGPGGFYQLSKIYPFIHLTLFYEYLKPLGAHNLLLHYLADMGIVGGIALMSLVVNQFRLARCAWRQRLLQTDAVSLALYSWAFLFLVTTIAEAGWMWGQLSFMAVFFAALIARQHARLAE